MLPSLLTLAGLVQFVQATATNTTTTCPSCDATSCSYRSIWSILARCGLTLLICVWHAVHPALPLPHHKGIDVFLYRVSLMLLAFFIPEFLSANACNEWCVAKEIRKDFHDHGYKWWTLTHSYFAVMGGFALHDNAGIREINGNELLSLLDAKKILNPLVTKGDIMDKSSSDGLGKAILMAQLFWFSTQFFVRAKSLSVTLVELDTFCIAVLTLLQLYFWWNKPYCPQRPHILYTRDYNSDDLRVISEGEDDSKGLLPGIPTIKTHRVHTYLLEMSSNSLWPYYTLSFVWSLLGTLHAPLAWSYEFPTEFEGALWGVASLALTGTSLILSFVAARGGLPRAFPFSCQHVGRPFISITIIAVIARVSLVAVMLASLLHPLPSSAYETIPWTNYIPHL